MLNLRKRIKELQETTTSVDAKNLCKEVLENFVNIPESQLPVLLEKFKSVGDSDKFVTKFIQVSEKISAATDLGVAKGISKIKESQINSYPALGYGLNRVENSLINQQSPEYMVIDSMLETLKPFIWDSTIDAVYQELKEKRISLNESITLLKSLYTLSNAKASFMYEGIVNKIQDHFVNPTESSRSSILEDLKKFNYYPEVRNLVESLSKIQKSENGGIQLIGENAKCTVSSIYSPVLLENNSEYFFIKNNFFAKADGKINKLNEETASTLPEKFRDICRIVSSPNVFIKEGKISFYLNRNKVEILENESKVDVLFNGSKVSSNELAKHMVSAGLFRIEEAKIAYDVQNIAESFNNIFNLDFGKLIESKMHNGSYVIIMKDNDKIYLNKVNESMKSNEFFSGLNATQARNLILEFIGYDIKESMIEYLEADEAKLKELKDAQLEIIKNISIVEANLNKINTSLQDAFLSTTPELNELKSMLESEINTLKQEHRDLNVQIKAFENKSTSDAGYEPGEEVTITETGDSATVTSVNSSRNTVTVVTADGESKELATSKISSLESSISKSNAKNADNKPKPANESEEADADDDDDKKKV